MPPRRYRINYAHRYAPALPVQEYTRCLRFVTSSPYHLTIYVTAALPSHLTRSPYRRVKVQNTNTFYDVDLLHSTALAVGPIHRLNLKIYLTA